MGLKRCPYCFEKIKKEAILCKHCKSSLVNTDNEGKDIKDEITENKAQINVQTEQLYDKRTAEFVMGLIGGIIGVIGGFFSIFIGGFGSAFGAEGMEILGNLGISAIIFSIIGIVGAALANSKGKLSGLFMLVATLGGIISISAYYILPGILLLIAAIMCLKKPNQNGDKFKWLIWIPSCIGLMAIVFAASFFLKSNPSDTNVDKTYKVGEDANARDADINNNANPVIEISQSTQTPKATPSNTPVATPTPTPSITLTPPPPPTSMPIVAKDTTSDDWEGTWSAEWSSINDASRLIIRPIDNSSFDFEFHAFSGVNTGEAFGTANISGNTAVYKDDYIDYLGEYGTIDFTLNDGKISVTTNMIVGGIGVGIDGDYILGEIKPEEYTLIDLGIFSESEDEAFRNLVGDEYETFTASFMLNKGYENIDTFPARVFSGFVRGLEGYLESIIMVDDNCNIWAATIGSDENNNGIIKYYTNTSQKNELPKTIENWIVWNYPVDYLGN